MKKSILLSLIIAVILILSTTACSKVEDEIIGKWKFEQMVVEPTTTQTWEFKSDGTLIRTGIKTDGSYTDECSFSFENKIAKKLIRINNSNPLYRGDTDVNGLWRVEHFKNDILKIRRVEMNEGEESPYLWREFLRLN